MKTFKIYRSILLNQGEEINTDNLGCSWTLCEIFAEDHAKDINRYHGKDGFVVLETTVTVDQIDWDNTLFSMDHRSYEYEVVVFSEDIEAEVRVVEGIDHIESGEIIEGNTGSNNFEDYCEEYDGVLSEEDFFETANEF